MVPVFKSVAGICRFYLLEVSPHLRLYVTPVQIHPEKPEMPISTPPDYSAEIARDVGLFFTQGLPEDSKALEEGVLSDRQYVSQADLVLQERLAQFRYELDHFARLDKGFLFFYFNSPDQSCHVLWRCFDEHSPNHAEADPAVRNRVRDLYVALDGALGRALDQVGDEALVYVISDHGFAPFYRSMHVNAWLREHGYLVLKPGVAPGASELLAGIDWSRTRAYAIGINGLYVNQRGRERWGIVAPGREREELLRELVEGLEATVDSVGGGRPVRYAYRADVVYSGAWRDRGPDIILGYERGWRGSNESALGEVPAEIFVDNLMKWSGDHCMAADVVPGTVIAERPFDLPDPTLADLAPTLLGLFGLPPGPEMTGRNLYTQEGGR
jgi:predicted AlkP superfamily phosphohydrolase/phosphomutase